MDTKRIITLSSEELETVINDLSLIVVSMDQIGSTHYGDLNRQAVELRGYFSKINAFKKLAEARGVLFEAFESQSTKEDILRLEESAEKLPYWKSHK